MADNNVTTTETTTTETNVESELTTMIEYEVQPRWKSWATWAAALGAIAILLQAVGLLDRWGITDESVNAIITAIGAILTAFGIVNNPTDKDNL